MRETPYTRLDLLVEALAVALQPWMAKPFAFFGHSMGALLGFELSRELRRQGAPQPVHLFVSGRRAPQLPERWPPIHGLPAPAFLRELQRRYNGVPEPILREPELMRLFLPILRADVTLIETYLYREEPPLACPISAFCGQDDSTVPEQDLAAWQAHTQGAFDLELIPGNHFFVQKAHALLIQALVEDLGLVLDAPVEQVSI